MSISWKRVLLVTLICYAVGFGFSVVMAIFSYSMETVLPAFQVDWIAATAWASFFTYLPVLQAWALLISFSVLPSTASRVSTAIASGVKAVTPAIVLVVLLTVVYVVVMAAADPAAVRTAANLEYTSSLARSLLDEGRNAIEEGIDEALPVEERRLRLSEAVTGFETYLAIVGEDEEVDELLTDAESRLAHLSSAAEQADEPAIDHASADAPTALSYLDRARSALRTGDYATAHYYATLAERLEPDGDGAAIAQQALEQLSEGVSPDEQRERTLYDRKLEAKGALSRGDLVNAYYLFSDLHDEYPRDVDISRYYQIVAQEVQTEAVFIEDVSDALLAPGWYQVAFVNRHTEEMRELIRLEKLVIAATGIYVRGVEVVRFTTDGRFIYQLSAPYGKVRDGHLILQVLDPEDQGVAIRPEYHLGDEAVDLHHLVELGPTESELLSIAVGSYDLRAVGVGRLTDLPDVLDEYGLLPVPVYHQLLRRLTLPFLFAIVSFVAIGFAWRNRSRYVSGPPVAAFFLVPFMPFALHPLYELFAYAQQLLSAWMVLALGLVVALVVLVAVEVVFLVIALAYLAIALSS